jgi:hypothetical protein
MIDILNYLSSIEDFEEGGDGGRWREGIGGLGKWANIINS